MSVPYDRVPRAPTGRVRRWFLVLAVAVLAGLVWWQTNPSTTVTGPSDPPQPPGGGQHEVVPPTPAPPPSADVVALADEAFMSDEGRELFFGTQPEILDATQFEGRCVRDTGRVLHAGAVGCFDGRRIVVYAPADPRLRGFVVETAAHELLHAAWETLDPDHHDELTALLEEELAQLPPTGRIHEQIAGSVGDLPHTRPTELFAYLGTQVWREGGLAPPLETTYRRFIADRAALVAVHTGWRARLDDMHAQIQRALDALAERRQAHAQQRADHEGVVASLGFYRQSYEKKVAELAAMPEAERTSTHLSWTWWDGTELPMAPADETLARAAELLSRDDAALLTRASELADEETAIAAERTRIDALRTDFDDLNAQLSPARS